MIKHVCEFIGQVRDQSVLIVGVRRNKFFESVIFFVTPLLLYRLNAATLNLIKSFCTPPYKVERSTSIPMRRWTSLLCYPVYYIKGMLRWRLRERTVQIDFYESQFPSVSRTKRWRWAQSGELHRASVTHWRKFSSRMEGLARQFAERQAANVLVSRCIAGRPDINRALELNKIVAYVY